MKKFKNVFVLVLVFALMFIAASCKNESTKIQETEIDSQNQAHNGFPLIVTDFLERERTIEKEPDRIITLVPSVTEIIFALGKGDKIVGVTDFDNYPKEVENIKKVGDFKGPNIEAIIAQSPDIIIASKLSGKNEMESLEGLGIPVVLLEAKTLEQIYASIEIIAQIVDAIPEGERLINEMKTEINSISNKVKNLPKVDVFYLTSFEGNWTAGNGTFISELIELAGGNNIANDVNGWAQYSMEELVNKNPDIIITSPHAGDASEIKNTVGYRDTNAVKNNSVFTVSDDDIIARASYRIVLGLKEIAEFLHPEVFQ